MFSIARIVWFIRVLPADGAGGRGEPESVLNAGVGSERAGRKEEVVVFDGAVSTVGSAARSPKRVKNALLELFGPLPKGGRIDDFLFSPQGAKLRSGTFWREVAEAAGAHFVGRFEFGGLKLSLDDTDDVGDLPLWCEEFATALTSALGFPEAPFAGALNNHIRMTDMPRSGSERTSSRT